MEPNELINKFIKVIQEENYLFTSEIIQKDIPSLQKNLKAIENDNLDSESLAEAISQWCGNHLSVRNAILKNPREISKVKKSNPAFGETTVENQYRIIQDELKKTTEKRQK